MVVAVRELMAGEEGVGVGKMVKRIRAERPELADVVSSKAVKAAKVAVEAEMAVEGLGETEGASGGNGGRMYACRVRWGRLMLRDRCSGGGEQGAAEAVSAGCGGDGDAGGVQYAGWAGCVEGSAAG